MKVLKEVSIRSGLYELAALVDVPVEDLKEEFEKTVESISGKNATFLGDDKEQNQQMQTLALEKMFKAYKKTLQFKKLLNKETSEEAKETEAVEEADE
jgi:hypothetical protein